MEGNIIRREGHSGALRNSGILLNIGGAREAVHGVCRYPAVCHIIHLTTYIDISFASFPSSLTPSYLPPTSHLRARTLCVASSIRLLPLGHSNQPCPEEVRRACTVKYRFFQHLIVRCDSWCNPVFSDPESAWFNIGPRQTHGMGAGSVWKEEPPYAVQPATSSGKRCSHTGGISLMQVTRCRAWPVKYRGRSPTNSGQAPPAARRLRDCLAHLQHFNGSRGLWSSQDSVGGRKRPRAQDHTRLLEQTVIWTTSKDVWILAEAFPCIRPWIFTQASKACQDESRAENPTVNGPCLDWSRINCGRLCLMPRGI